MYIKVHLYSLAITFSYAAHTCVCMCTYYTHMYLGLSDGLLDIIVSELVGNGVSDANTVALKEEIVVHHCLNVAIETPGHFVVKLHGDDVHERA